MNSHLHSELATVRVEETRRHAMGRRRAVARLAALDEAPVPPPPVLIAEVGGEPRAARSLATGHVVADRFDGTAELVELLALRAEQLRAAIAALDATGRAIGPSEAPAR